MLYFQYLQFKVPSRPEFLYGSWLVGNSLAIRAHKESTCTKETLGHCERLPCGIATVSTCTQGGGCGPRTKEDCLDCTGKLFALHSGNGKLVWTLSLDKDIPITSLLLGVSSHDPSHAPIVLLLGSTAGKGISMAVNGHTGEVLEVNSLPGGLEKVSPGCIHRCMLDPATQSQAPKNRIKAWIWCANTSMYRPSWDQSTGKKKESQRTSMAWSRTLHLLHARPRLVVHWEAAYIIVDNEAAL